MAMAELPVAIAGGLEEMTATVRRSRPKLWKSTPEQGAEGVKGYCPLVPLGLHRS
ncbi:hypothetical protein CRG98_013782 [Punica granatum]|uniref:Uncharacterized protein n=1 Tax=Punica granatum TaxID=22663 RepID=A0A2I0KBD2_PUNGR|nr:hypothetical protein CRG98_013782 [Punica granatum]